MRHEDSDICVHFLRSGFSLWLSVFHRWLVMGRKYFVHCAGLKKKQISLSFLWNKFDESAKWSIIIQGLVPWSDTAGKTGVSWRGVTHPVALGKTFLYQKRKIFIDWLFFFCLNKLNKPTPLCLHSWINWMNKLTLKDDTVSHCFTLFIMWRTLPPL